VLLRPAGPADSDAIAALFRRSFGGLTFLPTLHTPEEDRAHFSTVVREHEVWVAEEDGNLVGFISVAPEMVDHLYVDPTAQRRSIGTALLERAKERRPGGFRLWTFQRNEGARRFYERHGLRAVEFTDGEDNEEREPDVLYEWHGRSRVSLVAATLTDDELLGVLDEYLTILAGHPGAEEMMDRILTQDFETGFVGGFLWRGLDGLRDFLSQRGGFFDERHQIKELLERGDRDGEARARTRLRFFLRRWESPSPVSEEFTGDCYHEWRVRQEDGRWRVAAQIVERFDDLNDNAARLFSTPDEGLRR
jgi:putative acetyltransferase